MPEKLYLTSVVDPLRTVKPVSLDDQWQRVAVNRLQQLHDNNSAERLHQRGHRVVSAAALGDAP
jgi:hypothetical protein